MDTHPQDLSDHLAGIEDMVWKTCKQTTSQGQVAVRDHAMA